MKTFNEAVKATSLGFCVLGIVSGIVSILEYFLVTRLWVAAFAMSWTLYVVFLLVDNRDKIKDFLHSWLCRFQDFVLGKINKPKTQIEPSAVESPHIKPAEPEIISIHSPDDQPLVPFEIPEAHILPISSTKEELETIKELVET